MQRTLPVVSVNGVIDAQVSPLDRGFTYGDGVFETCRMINAKIPLWNLHFERLINSCKKLAIAINTEQITQQLSQLIGEASSEQLTEAVVKITVTRGQGGRGYKLPEIVNPTIVIAIFPASNYPKDYYTQGISVRICNQRLSCNNALAGLKHLNRLEQILARAEWQDNNIAEGIMLDTKDNIIEAVFSNIFMVKSGELLTPDLSEAGVAGVMRRFIIEEIAPQLKCKVRIAKIALSDLLNADEMFLCNSLYGIWPVRSILADKEYSFNLNAKSNSIAFALQNMLEKTLETI